MRKIKKIAINGRFLARKTTGVDRFAREIVRELDSLCKIDESYIIVVSNDMKIVDLPKLHNIKVIRFGRGIGVIWEQLFYSLFLIKSGFIGMNLCNSAPLLNPGIVCIHDMAIRANQNNFSVKFKVWYRLLYSLITRKAKRIITVSKFSKKEITKFYPTTINKIYIVPNAWQHVDKIEEDNSVLTKFDLQVNSYYFSMSSLSPNKNLKWIIETAKMNQESRFIIAGNVNQKVFKGQKYPASNNVTYVGYISDNEAKSMMKNCKAFIYPTFYEGFGIPPLEAIACGAKDVIVSNTEIMHEIYKDSVIYIDPKYPCGDLDDLIQRKHPDDSTSILSQYSWMESAKLLKKIIDNL